MDLLLFILSLQDRQDSSRGGYAVKVTYIKYIIPILAFLLLTGCLYPDSEKGENQVSNEAQLEAVQTAVDQYREDKNGLVPIRTKPSDTPIFEKYLIDFAALINANAIAEIPGNSFESGGHYQYILLTPDEDPTVKVIDLRITETLRSVNIRLDAFRQKNTYPAFGDKLEEGIYLIDHEKLGLDGPATVVSPYSKENLPIIMDVHGNLFVDYRIDLIKALDEYDHNYQEGDDIRYLLTDHYPFAPAYALPYTIKDGEPVLVKE